LKSYVSGEDDIKFNAEKILLALKEIGIISYIKVKDFV